MYNFSSTRSTISLRQAATPVEKNSLALASKRQEFKLETRAVVKSWNNIEQIRSNNLWSLAWFLFLYTTILGKEI